MRGGHKSFFYGDCPVRAQYTSPEQRSGYKKCPCFQPCKGFTIVEPFQGALEACSVSPGAARSCFVFAFQAIFSNHRFMPTPKLNNLLTQ
jgi:hypothetical protein